MTAVPLGAVLALAAAVVSACTLYSVAKGNYAGVAASLSALGMLALSCAAAILLM